MDMNANIKKWYLEAYPDDPMGVDLKDESTFSDMEKALDKDSDEVYSVLGVLDSVIRERVFTKLSEIMGVDYRYIYKRWLSLE